MCIICVKAAGIEMPAEATLETMWENNPDGAGFMYVANGNQSTGAHTRNPTMPSLTRFIWLYRDAMRPAVRQKDVV